MVNWNTARWPHTSKRSSTESMAGIGVVLWAKKSAAHSATLTIDMCALISVRFDFLFLNIRLIKKIKQTESI